MTYRVRNPFTWFFLMVVALIVGAADVSAMKICKFYNVKEGQIEYRLSGLQKGTVKLYFTEYGNKTRRETDTKMEMGGITQETKTVVLTDGPWIYTLDPTTNEWTKRKNPMFESFAGDGINSGKNFMEAMGGTETGKDEVLGHRCKIWKAKQLMTETCVTSDWFALWTKSGMPGMEIVETAIDIKIGPVPAGITSLPAGTQVVEGADPMQALRQFQQQGADRSSTRKKKGKPLTQEEMREAEKMREQFQGKDFNQMMESMKKLQEQFKPKSDSPTQ